MNRKAQPHPFYNQGGGSGANTRTVTPTHASSQIRLQTCDLKGAELKTRKALKTLKTRKTSEADPDIQKGRVDPPHALTILLIHLLLTVWRTINRLI